ncbi:MAG: hypothetical protein AABZ64_06725 [Nitrospinota bacterium]
MSGTPARKALGWPVCTLLLVLGLGALGWWTYSKWQEEQAVRQRPPQAVQQAAPQAVQAPQAAQPAPSQAPARALPPEEAYRGLPTYLIAGFAAVMAAVLGAILYLWWSLKDLEGGKKSGEGEGESRDFKR